MEVLLSRLHHSSDAMYTKEFCAEACTHKLLYLPVCGCVPVGHIPNVTVCQREEADECHSKWAILHIP